MALKHSRVRNSANQPMSNGVYEFADDFDTEDVNELGSVTGGNLSLDDAIFADGGWAIVQYSVLMGGANGSWYASRLRRNDATIAQSGPDQNPGSGSHNRSGIQLVRVTQGDTLDCGGWMNTAATDLLSAAHSPMLSVVGAPLVADPTGGPLSLDNPGGNPRRRGLTLPGRPPVGAPGPGRGPGGGGPPGRGGGGGRGPGGGGPPGPGGSGPPGRGGVVEVFASIVNFIEGLITPKEEEDDNGRDS